MFVAEYVDDPQEYSGCEAFWPTLGSLKQGSDANCGEAKAATV